jgi:tetratricopeptide (TPR) repeat protein
MPRKQLSVTVSFLQLLLLTSVFLLALNAIEDPDVWLHLSFGRLIWDLKGLPATEPFLYTMQGQPFSYSSWLFALIYYAAYHAFNIYGVILLKAITVTTVFYILLRDSLRPVHNPVVAVLATSLVVIMARYRFVERPDTFMMLFLAFSIFSLNAFVYNNKKYLYALPVVHMLWANSHSSINLMFVPFIAFIAGGFLQRSLAAKSGHFRDAPSFSQLKTITLIFVASFAASLVSPYFIRQYFFGAQLLASDWFKQEIAELRPPTWASMKWPFIMAPAVVLSFILNRKHISLKDAFLVAPFIILSFTAVRFVFILCIVAGPILARNISGYLAGSTWWQAFSAKKLVFAGAAVWIVLSAALVFAKVKPFSDPHHLPLQNFGFKINYDFYPEGALGYMDERNIAGRVLNPFKWGQYISWRDYPKREAFIDGRGYLPDELLETVSDGLYDPGELDKLYSTYGFESLLIEYPVLNSPVAIEADSALKQQGWVLVYWDDISLLYLKSGGKYDPVIQADQYRYVNPVNGIASITSMLSDQDGRIHVVRELQRNIRETGSSRAYAFLGQVYNQIGQYREALEAFSHVRAIPSNQDPLPHRYDGMGYAYSQLGRFDEAISSSREGLKFSKNPLLYLSIGAAYIKKNDAKNAINYLEKALNADAKIAPAYPLLISLYYQSNMTGEAERLEERYNHVLLVEQGREYINRGIQDEVKGRYDAAADEFKRAMEIDPANPDAYSQLGCIYMDNGMMNEALKYEREALEIDPNDAMADYWLAMIYRNFDNAGMAIKYFKEYIRIEPAGHLSRMAKQYIKDLSVMSKK